MPRLARLDAPGVLHHIMIRGIERRKIFRDDRDRDDFLERLSDILPATKTSCYAWSFLSNHAHFLLRSGESGISKVMAKLLTGYAVRFNRKYRRHGPLFQNRYKSIVCQEDAYLKELVRYIHLNPLRVNIVPDIQQLNRYPYSGHSTIDDSRGIRTHAGIEIQIGVTEGYFPGSRTPGHIKIMLRFNPSETCVAD